MASLEPNWHGGHKLNNISVMNTVVSSVMLMHNTAKQIRENNSIIDYGLNI